MRPQIVRAMALMVAMLVGPGSADAGEATDRVRAILDDVLAIQNSPELQGPQQEERRSAEVKRVIARSFNFTEMARRSLGREWDRLEPGQRQEFTETLQGLFQESYPRLVLDFLRRETIGTIRFGPETGRGETAQVQMVIEGLAREQIPVEYRLLRAGGRWDMYDVSIDGVSIVDNYRSGFTKIIRTSSFEALLKKMKVKQGDLAPSNP